MQRCRYVMVIFMLMLGECFSGQTLFAAQDDWHFTVKPYGVAVNIGGDASVGRVDGANVDVDFGDIMDTLQSAFMIDIAAYHKSGWGVIFDYGYMDLGSDISLPYGGILGADVYQGVLEAFVTRQRTFSLGYWDLFTGLRWWDNDIDLRVDPVILPGSRSFSLDEDWVDLVVGVSCGIPLTENVTLLGRVDVGGFGFSSDFTATLLAGVRYRFTEMISVELQYKALWVDYEDGTRGHSNYFKYDTVTHGPLLGITVEF